MADKESSYGFEETMVTLTDEDGLEKDFMWMRFTRQMAGCMPQ